MSSYTVELLESVCLALPAAGLALSTHPFAHLLTHSLIHSINQSLSRAQIVRGLMQGAYHITTQWTVSTSLACLGRQVSSPFTRVMPYCTTRRATRPLAATQPQFHTSRKAWSGADQRYTHAHAICYHTMPCPCPSSFLASLSISRLTYHNSAYLAP